MLVLQRKVEHGILLSEKANSIRRITMPATIVPAGCAPPTCNLVPGDVEGFVDSLTNYHASFASAFRRPEQQHWAQVYLRGLLSDLARKPIERIALT